MERKEERNMKATTGIACHTFGELLQGQLEGSPFLVSLPVASYVRATFYPGSGGELVTSPQKIKVRRMIRRMAEKYEIPIHGTLLLEQSLPEGKGFATSTADMVAACRAVARAYHLPLLPEHISSLLVSIEPTDGIMYEEIVAYRHHKGEMFASLGSLPPLTIVGIDKGGKVDTVSFNKNRIACSYKEEKEYAFLLQKLQEAFRMGDSELIGHISTRSAEMHQKHLRHPYFSELAALCREIKGLGVVIAHSGTLAGILLDAQSPACKQQTADIMQKITDRNRSTYVFQCAGNEKRVIV
jgi:uncharacterized protein involved in propanediol utilization